MPSFQSTNIQPTIGGHIRHSLSLDDLCSSKYLFDLTMFHQALDYSDYSNQDHCRYLHQFILQDLCFLCGYQEAGDFPWTRLHPRMCQTTQGFARAPIGTMRNSKAANSRTTVTNAKIFFSRWSSSRKMATVVSTRAHVSNIFLLTSISLPSRLPYQSACLKLGRALTLRHVPLPVHHGAEDWCSQAGLDCIYCHWGSQHSCQE